MKTILAPIDFSPATDLVVKEAATLARALDGRVILLTVVQPLPMLGEYAGMIDISQITAAGEKNAARQLATQEATLKDQFVKADSVQVTGSPVRAILEAAADQDADYIVMGSHGHTAFYDLLVGSTTHGVLMRSKCPVVIVPAAKKLAPARGKKTRSTG